MGRRAVGAWASLAIALTLGCSDPAQPTDAYLNYEFWRLDCDGDQALSFEELRRFPGPRALAGDETPLDTPEFAGAAADGDGRLTIGEYTVLINKDGHYHYSPHPNCRAGVSSAAIARAPGASRASPPTGRGGGAGRRAPG